jgi:chromosomal replication initiation ATPase DnaA
MKSKKYKSITPVIIQNIFKTCQLLNINPSELFIKKRTQKLCQLRHSLWHYLYNTCKITTIDLGLFFNVAHDTISYGVKKIDYEKDIYKDIECTLNIIKEVFEGTI